MPPTTASGQHPWHIAPHTAWYCTERRAHAAHLDAGDDVSSVASHPLLERLPSLSYRVRRQHMAVGRPYGTVLVGNHGGRHERGPEGVQGEEMLLQSERLPVNKELDSHSLLHARTIVLALQACCPGSASGRCDRSHTRTSYMHTRGFPWRLHCDYKPWRQFGALFLAK